MDIQEKVNQAYIFYRTGKLAYHSSKIWEAIDQSYDVTTRVDMFKRFAMIRAAEVNNFLGEKKYTDQLHDFWKALVSVPFEARRINVEYGLTSKVFKFGRHVTSSVRNFALDLVSGTGISTGYIAPPVVPAKPTRRSTKRKTKSSPSSLTSMGLEAVKKVQSVVEQLLSSGGESPSDRARKRGQVINPWVPFWAYLSKYPTRKRNGRWALQ